MKRQKPITGGQLVVECLEALGIEIVFGIPGAKIDSVFNALLDSNIRLVVCRHEQNATFMAAMQGRLTGKPGVVLVTSGPGVANLTTGLLTATTEGDPVIAIGGNVPRNMLLKESHQKANNVEMLESVTKSAVEITDVNNIPEAFAKAYRVAKRPRSGSCFISLPQDVLTDETKVSPIAVLHDIGYAGASSTLIDQAAELINRAALPILFLGQEASRPNNACVIRDLLKHHHLPTISTYQAAGVVSRELVDDYIGRVGLFKNQEGDKVLQDADVVICVGINLVEYDPEVWNVNQDKKIIHIDYNPAHIHLTYQPEVELIGDIGETIRSLDQVIRPKIKVCDLKGVKSKHQQFMDIIEEGKKKTGTPIHPLRFIAELREHIDDDTRVVCDIGSVYMWIARYFLSYKPHHLMFSNGQQTLGVALPWALSCNLLNPGEQIISISGDGGFLFSAMELETAVREGVKFIHFMWRDGSYNMVAEQELMKYGRESGVHFGRLSIIEFAAGFGATGFELNHPDEFSDIFAKAKAEKGPVLIDVQIDYSDNMSLFTDVHDNAIH